MKNRILILFERLNHFISENNDFAFSRCWNEQSFKRMFGGPEAISGEILYKELCDNKLMFEPDCNFELNENEDTALIGCFIKNENNSVDYIYFLIEDLKNECLIRAASRSRVEMEVILEQKASLPVLIKSGNDRTESDSEKELFQQYFNELNDALINHSENKFASLWVEKAYFHNLCGDGGLSGKELYTVAKNSAWQLNPVYELSTFFEKPAAVLIHLSIWLKLLEIEKAGEEGLLLLVKIDNKVKILGYGTDLSSLRHLYLKYKEGTVL